MNTEELNALKERAYKTAVEHGFHEEERPDAYWLGLVMSEMGEAINADRKGSTTQYTIIYPSLDSNTSTCARPWV